MTTLTQLRSVFTIPGAGGQIQTLDFIDPVSSARDAVGAVLGALTNSIIGGNLVPVVAVADGMPSAPIGASGMLQVNVGGQYVIGAGYTALIDNASTPATVFGGASDGQRVVAANGGLTFSAGTGAGTVIAGGGLSTVAGTVSGFPFPLSVHSGRGNAMISVPSGAGAQYIFTGDGDDTIAALSGNNTIDGGAGANFILAQGGNDLITSEGQDLISIPDGNATITALGQTLNGPTTGQTIFLGSGNSRVSNQFALNGPSARVAIVVGSGAATVNSLGTDQIWMSIGGGVVNSRNTSIIVLDLPSLTASIQPTTLFPTTPQAGDTIIGGSGAATVNATSYASDFVFAGSGALNFTGGIGASTILGNAAGTASITGGVGSVIAIAYGSTSFTGGAGAATVAAFGGSVTINGGAGIGLYVGAPGGQNRISQGTGQATMYGGGDGDIIAAGSVGGGILVAGRGTETLIGGTGADLFAVLHGNASNAVVRNFIPGQDFMNFAGFSTTEATNALAASVLIAGSRQLTLSDGTRILFVGVTGLTTASFL